MGLGGQGPHLFYLCYLYSLAPYLAMEALKNTDRLLTMYREPMVNIMEQQSRSHMWSSSEMGETRALKH